MIITCWIVCGLLSQPVFLDLNDTFEELGAENIGARNLARNDFGNLEYQNRLKPLTGR